MAPSGGPAPATAMPFSEKDFQAEDDFRTLQRAEEVSGDKKRLAAAMKKGKKQRDEMDAVLGARGSRRRKDGT